MTRRRVTRLRIFMSFLRDCKERSFDRSGRSILAMSASSLAETGQTATLAVVIVHLPTRGNAAARRPLRRGRRHWQSGILALAALRPHTPRSEHREPVSPAPPRGRSRRSGRSGDPVRPGDPALIERRRRIVRRAGRHPDFIDRRSPVLEQDERERRLVHAFQRMVADQVSHSQQRFASGRVVIPSHKLKTLLHAGDADFQAVFPHGAYT